MCVEKIKYDWFSTHEIGEEYQSYEVGKDGVHSIKYYSEDYYELNMGEIIKPYAVVNFNDGHVEQIYTVSHVTFGVPE